MKSKIFKTLALVFIVTLIGLASYDLGFSNARKKHYEVVKYGAEWGCLVGSENSCTQFEDEQDMADCRKEALKFCPEAAISFERFLRQSYKKVK
jgi:ferredoxin